MIKPITRSKVKRQTNTGNLMPKFKSQKKKKITTHTTKPKTTTTTTKKETQIASDNLYVIPSSAHHTF